MKNKTDEITGGNIMKQLVIVAVIALVGGGAFFGYKHFFASEPVVVLPDEIVVTEPVVIPTAVETVPVIEEDVEDEEIEEEVDVVEDVVEDEAEEEELVVVPPVPVVTDQTTNVATNEQIVVGSQNNANSNSITNPTQSDIDAFTDQMAGLGITVNWGDGNINAHGQTTTNDTITWVG